VTGDIAYAQWKVPFELLPGEASPPAEPMPEPVTESIVEPERIPAPPPVAQETSPPSPERPVLSPRPVMVKPIRPPDDPGPSGGEALGGVRQAFADG
jgi:hypothetical protein